MKNLNKNWIISAMGAVILALLILICCMVAKPNVIEDPTTPTEDTPINVEEIDGVITVNVYGDIFAAPEDGFEFTNPKSNRCDLKFTVTCGERKMFEGDFIAPGETSKWDMSAVIPGLYDCIVRVDSRCGEDGKNGNSYEMHQMFYIDDVELETNQLFTVTIPEFMSLTVSEDGVAFRDDVVIVNKCVDENNMPKPRSEQLYVVPQIMSVNDEELILHIENMFNKDDNISYEFKLVYADTQEIEVGEYTGTTVLYIDPYSETNSLMINE